MIYPQPGAWPGLVSSGLLYRLEKRQALKKNQRLILIEKISCNDFVALNLQTAV
jgi:hypothetical protein